MLNLIHDVQYEHDVHPYWLSAGVEINISNLLAHRTSVI